MKQAIDVFRRTLLRILELEGRLPWQRLVPQALLTALGVTALGISSVIYMPRAIGTAAAQFGFIGVAFALLSWLFAFALVVVVAAALGSTLVERPAVAESPDSGDAGAGTPA